MSSPSPALVRELEATVGLSFAGPHHGRMLAVIEAEADRCGCADEQAYAALLRADHAALERLLDALTITEGYFFRDARQVAMVEATILPDLAGRATRGVEAWSAGCGGGEEPYTVAMLGIAAGLGPRLRVLGTDVSAAAVDLGRSASYGAWSLRGVDEARRATWFRQDGGRWEVRPDVRRMVRLATGNLLDDPPGRFDLVLCRNLLMYLTPVAVARASEVLATALRPGGWLLTGASDPPLVSPRLVRVRTPQGLVYRLRRDVPDGPAGATAPTPGPQPVVAAAAPTAGGATTPSAVAPEARTERRAEAVADGAGPDETGADETGAAEADAAMARYRGALDHLAAGRAEEAGHEARAALYLDPALVVAHLVVGHAARACGRPGDATRSYRRAARALASLPADQAVAGGDGHRAAHLAAVAARLAGDEAARG